MRITQGDYDGKAVIISWVTPDEPGSSKVHYGSVQGKHDFVAKGTYSNYTFYKYKSGYTHHCLVSGLEVNYTITFCLLVEPWQSVNMKLYNACLIYSSVHRCVDKCDEY